jgi:hypothetical protein
MKTTMRYHYNLTRMTKNKNQNAGKDVEKLEFSNTGD